MSQGESKRSRGIRKHLELFGWYTIKVHGSALMQAGLPDILVCAEGLFVGLETKEPDKRNNTSVQQERQIDLIKQAGGYACVVTNKFEAEAAVRRAIALHQAA